MAIYTLHEWLFNHNQNNPNNNRQSNRISNDDNKLLDIVSSKFSRNFEDYKKIVYKVGSKYPNEKKLLIIFDNPRDNIFIGNTGAHLQFCCVDIDEADPDKLDQYMDQCVDMLNKYLKDHNIEGFFYTKNGTIFYGIDKSKINESTIFDSINII